MARAFHCHRSVRELGRGPRRRLRRLNASASMLLTYRPRSRSARNRERRRPPRGNRGRTSHWSSVAATGCGEGTIRRSSALKTTEPAAPSEPWCCESSARAGARAEAVVPRPRRERLDGAGAAARCCDGLRLLRLAAGLRRRCCIAYASSTATAPRAIGAVPARARSGRSSSPACAAARLKVVLSGSDRSFAKVVAERASS
jgi:hypothetical protein